MSVQVKVRLALTREQAEAHDRASEALRKLQVQHEESASSGAQSLKQVRLDCLSSLLAAAGRSCVRQFPAHIWFSAMTSNRPGMQLSCWAVTMPAWRLLLQSAVLRCSHAASTGLLLNA